MIVVYYAIIHDGLVRVVYQILGVFYAKDGLLGLQDSEWLQGYLNVLIGLF